MSERSAPYPFLRNDAQMKYNSQLIDLSVQPLFEFYANDEWVYLSQSPFGGVARSYVGVADEDGGTLYVDEPFFVSGKKRFVIQQTTGFVRLILAKRRELLSWNQDKESFDSNSPGQSLLYQAAFTAPAVGVNTNWAYLDANLTWQIAPIGQTPNGMPFGWQATQARAGRYYNVEYATQDNGNGLTQIHVVYPSNPAGLGTAGYGFAISPNQAAMAGSCSLGDEPFASSLSSAPAGVGLISNMKSGRLWTIAISVAVAGAIGPGGFLSILRRGY